MSKLDLELIKAICSVENQILNGNWTYAQEKFLATPRLRIEHLTDTTDEDKIILADYIIEELKNADS